jgi:hypothetical protein
MGVDDFDQDLVRAVVRDLASTFYTADVSGDARMRQRLKVSSMSKAERDTYLRMTGRFLAMNRTSFGLRLEPDSRPGLGRRWEKVVP